MQHLPFWNKSSFVCTGTLPSSWAEAGRFAKLQEMGQLPLQGSLPAAWGGAGALPALQTLILSHTSLSGTLPAEWGRPEGFQALSTMSISSCSITGAAILPRNCTQASAGAACIV